MQYTSFASRFSGLFLRILWCPFIFFCIKKIYCQKASLKCSWVVLSLFVFLLRGFMTSTAKVPDGMSYVNAFYAIYQRTPGSMSLMALIGSDSGALSTPESVKKIFQDALKSSLHIVPLDHNRVVWIDYAASKRMKLHFGPFLHGVINTEFYDAIYGPGAAQSALNEYDKIPKENRFDPNDACDFNELIRLD